MPVAPPASEIRFHRRTSSGSVIRPSSRGRPGTWGCIHSGPACASACQNSLRGPPARALARRAPARLACPGPGAHQVDGVPLLPRLAALARGHPGEAPPLHLRGRAPLVAGPRRHVGQAGGDAVGHDGVVGIGAPDGLHAPAQEAVGVVDAEAQPVQHVRVRPRRPRGVHVLPLGDGVALPGPADGARRVVPLAQPLPEARHRGRAVAVGAGDVALVPHVVRRGGRMGAVAGGQRGQESLRQAQGVRVVQAQAGEAAGGAAAAHLAVRRAPAGVHVAGVGEAPPGPLRGGRQHLGDHRGHAIRGRQVELAS